MASMRRHHMEPEQGRAAFNFTAGVNLLDASDPAVRPPNPKDLAEWMSETDDDASDVQAAHHFNRRRPGQGEPAFFEEIIDVIRAQVGMDAARAAFFLGHVELIGLEPGGNGTVIDPTSADAADHLGPDRVVVPDVISTPNGVSIMTGALVADILSANPGLAADAPLPASAHSDGIDVPGTVHHRTLAARSRTERAVETKADIAAQHGVKVDALVRANPALNHREPREGEWILIPVH